MAENRSPLPAAAKCLACVIFAAAVATSSASPLQAQDLSALGPLQETANRYLAETQPDDPEMAPTPSVQAVAAYTQIIVWFEACFDDRCFDNPAASSHAVEASRREAMLHRNRWVFHLLRQQAALGLCDPAQTTLETLSEVALDDDALAGRLYLARAEVRRCVEFEEATREAATEAGLIVPHSARRAAVELRPRSAAAGVARDIPDGPSVERERPMWPWILIGSGLVALGSSVAVYASLSDERETLQGLDDDCAIDVDGIIDTCDEDARTALRGDLSQGTNWTVGLAVGGALVTSVGVVARIMGRAAEDLELEVGMNPDGWPTLGASLAF